MKQNFTVTDMNSKLIKTFVPGDKIVAFFVIRKKELRVKKSDGTPYLALEFGDASGRISAAIWDQVAQYDSELQVGEIVKVRGTVFDYNNGLSFHVDRIRKVRPEDHIRTEMFLPVNPKNLETLENRFHELVDFVENPYLSKLLHSVFDEPDFWSNFRQAPGGKLWHHNRLGGLMEHSIGVSEICLNASDQYPLISKDLLLAGALLHDIGKVKSYVTQAGFIDYADDGRLLGHIVLGYNQTERSIDEIPDFPLELRKEILHLILSHHGKLEQGSPVVPMTIEAIVLYHADEMDSKADAFTRIMTGEIPAGKKWSNYVKLLNRFIYFGDKDI
ncbi:3'-5' exoribonuclease YhaM [bacterium BMS3Abin05]|nr:3'-5' exoribonuclease YhaM [bacterium BMS3Abin05]